jgi:hypothetical protein
MGRQHSFSHFVDVEAARRGMTREEIFQCLARTVEEHYRHKGRIVTIAVDESDTAAVLAGRELAVRDGQGVWLPLPNVEEPPLWLMQERVEAFLEERRRAARWTLVRAQCKGLEDDYALVEIADDLQPDLAGQVAVLPRSRWATRDAFDARAPARWMVVCEHFPEAVDGGHQWRGLSVPWLASRVEAALVAGVAQHYFQAPFEFGAAYHGAAAMLVCPAESDFLATIIGDKGERVAKLKQLLGLDRLCVARASRAADELGRLRSAVKHVVGLREHEFLVEPPMARPALPAKEETPLPCIVVPEEHAPRLVGKNGCNLYFVRKLSGVASTWRGAEAKAFRALLGAAKRRTEKAKKRRAVTQPPPADSSSAV